MVIVAHDDQVKAYCLLVRESGGDPNAHERVGRSQALWTECSLMVEWRNMTLL
jgi:hypothetical protein